MNIATGTLNKLQGLERLYRQGFHSEIIDRTIDKLLDMESHRARKEQRELEAHLAAYESQYQISSKEFYRRFRAGELGDEMDFVEWSIFYELHRVILERIEVLGISTQ